MQGRPRVVSIRRVHGARGPNCFPTHHSTSGMGPGRRAPLGRARGLCASATGGSPRQQRARQSRETSRACRRRAGSRSGLLQPCACSRSTPRRYGADRRKLDLIAVLRGEDRKAVAALHGENRDRGACGRADIARPHVRRLWAPPHRRDNNCRRSESSRWAQWASAFANS